MLSCLMPLLPLRMLDATIVEMLMTLMLPPPMLLRQQRRYAMMQRRFRYHARLRVAPHIDSATRRAAGAYAYAQMLSPPA